MTPPKPPYLEMANARRCPLFPRHRLHDEGYESSLFAHRYACPCGEWLLRHSDESRHRAGSRHPGDVLRAELGL